MAKYSSAQKLHAIKMALAAIENTLRLCKEDGIKLPSENALLIAGEELLDIVESECPEMTPGDLLKWAQVEIRKMEAEE